MRWMATCVLTLAVVALQDRTTDAAPIIISQPDAAYQAATTKIVIPPALGGNSISDAALTVTFTTAGSLSVLQVPGTWGTWSSPPFSESATPRVLFNNAGSLTFNLSQSVGIFGFELEPDEGDAIPFTAQFFDGATLVGTIGPLGIDAVSGARLFALNGNGATFNRVVVSGSDEFAIAQIRYALQQVNPPTTVPEPASLGVWAIVGLIGAGSLARYKFRRN